MTDSIVYRVQSIEMSVSRQIIWRAACHVAEDLFPLLKTDNFEGPRTKQGPCYILSDGSRWGVYSRDHEPEACGQPHWCSFVRVDTSSIFSIF